jgi:N-acetylglucosamine-6-phosphate deacetylase
VTDAMSAAGMGPGTYRLGGRKVIVDQASARLEDGTLAGSILLLNDAVKKMAQLSGARLEDAFRMASETPARLLGLSSKGRLEKGLDADVVLMDEALTVESTYVGGHLAFQRGGD